jgi:hypothetical protein
VPRASNPSRWVSRGSGSQRGDHAHSPCRAASGRRGIPGLQGRGYEVLSALPTSANCRGRALEGNRFVITIRGLACDPAGLAQRVQYRDRRRA